MTALGEWLVQEGTAKEAGKETLLQAAALLMPLANSHGQRLTTPGLGLG